ncbi:uncharacterized membrane protein YhaH (DUF805 family) [Weissella uvarum]|uniref:DUF805 domain-containing protein n=1 Tax=Weissella uvarum TaxID=1479233 RepID=UPI0019613DDA|nr:uncharacterized membrane protein YhaH (DUF805 family) [Weissella uvarum]MCM0595632.1 DUF805 domain-containing protein [Weissella uvarum]
MISYKTAFTNFFKKGFNFKGTSTRAEFWWMVGTFMLATLIWGVLGLIVFALTGNKVDWGAHSITFNDNQIMVLVAWLAVMVVVMIILLIPYMALQVRRFRDTALAEPLVWIALIISIVGQFGGANTLMNIISGIAGLLVLILCVLPTNYLTKISWLSRK